MIFEHYMIPKVNKMMRNVYHRLPLYTYSCVMEWHASFLASVKRAEGVIVCLCYWLFLFIAVIVARIIHVVIFYATSVKNRMTSGIPATIADVETTYESYLLINYHHLSVMTPQLNAVTRMSHHLYIRMKPCQILLGNHTVEGDCES